MPTATPTRTPSPTFTPTATPLPTVEKPIIAEWSTLDSYHLQMTMRIGTEPASQFVQWRLLYDWANQPRAYHMVLSMEGTGLPHPEIPMKVDAIGIGDTIWSKVGGQWMQTQSPAAQSMRGNWEGLEKNFRDLQLSGEETVNGIQCKRYAVDENLPSVSVFGLETLASHALGDIWVAHRPDLPTVVIRLQVQIRMKASAARTAGPSPILMLRATPPPESVWSWDYEVTHVNAPIVIRPPAGFRSP